MGDNKYLINCDGNGYANTGDTMQCLAEEASKLCTPQGMKFRFLDSDTNSQLHIGVNLANGNPVPHMRPHSSATVECYSGDSSGVATNQDDEVPRENNTGLASGAAPEIAEKAFSAFASIVTFDELGNPLSLGSGFFVTDHLLVTNFHVIKGGAAALIKPARRGRNTFAKSLYAADPNRDLAILFVEYSHPSVLSLGDSSRVRIGERIYALGNPEGLEGTFSEGMVSSLRKNGTIDLLQITAPISPGSSGGPVLDSKSEVVGVSTAFLMSGQNLNFAVPAKYIRQLMNASRGKTTAPLTTPQNSAVYSQGGSAIQLTPEVRLIDHWFFLGQRQADGKSKNHRSNDVFVKPGQNFGCYVLYSTNKLMIHFSAELRGPGPLKEFSAHGFQMSKSDDQLTETAEKDFPGGRGNAGVYWGISPNDPVGTYEIKCSLEGVPVETHSFTVNRITDAKDREVTRSASPDSP